MEKSDTLILGGGISGLSMRFFLSKRCKKETITLLEAQETVGGVIGKARQAQTHFDLGPKTFAARRCPHLLKLIDQLQLSEKLRFSSPDAKYRYLAAGQNLQALPSSLWDFLKKPSYRKWIGPLIGEWRRPVFLEDETIEAFALRRFGPQIAKTLFDPMTIGIFGGDYKKLSVSACFPELKAMEKEFGSITKALFSKKKKGQQKGLFTLEKGMSTLMQALKEHGRGAIYEKSAVSSVRKVADGWQVTSSKGEHFAKKLVVATDLVSAQRLLKHELPEIVPFKKSTPMLDMYYVTLCFKQDLFKQYPGFGLIIPSDEKSPILGVIFDSHLYPRKEGFFYTVLCNKQLSEKEITKELYKLAKREEKLLFSHIKLYKKALPQFLIGHRQRVRLLEKALSRHENLVLLGNFLEGVSVEACVKKAYQSALILKM